MFIIVVQFISMHNFKELTVWQRAISLAINIYKLSQSFSTKDQFILSSQLSRCAFSIPSNIAEGAGKGSNKDFCRYISIAEGSSFELETQLIIIKEIISNKIATVDVLLKDLIIIQKMLYRLRTSLK